MRRFIIHDLAEAEALETSKYYQSCIDGLGIEFFEELDATFASIHSQPETWSESFQGCHKLSMTRFPYNVIYIFDDAEIMILAVMHCRREPKYWISRLP